MADGTGIEWTGRRLGVVKTAAKRTGLSLEEYAERCKTEKWCTRCKAWHARSAFYPDVSRGDGLKATCRASAIGRGRQGRWRMRRVGKRAAPKTLDGVVHQAFPEVTRG